MAELDKEKINKLNRYCADQEISPHEMIEVLLRRYSTRDIIQYIIDTIHSGYLLLCILTSFSNLADRNKNNRTLAKLVKNLRRVNSSYEADK